jgi:hypothetical protein
MGPDILCSDPVRGTRRHLLLTSHVHRPELVCLAEQAHWSIANQRALAHFPTKPRIATHPPMAIAGAVHDQRQ